MSKEENSKSKVNKATRYEVIADFEAIRKKIRKHYAELMEAEILLKEFRFYIIFHLIIIAITVIIINGITVMITLFSIISTDDIVLGDF